MMRRSVNPRIKRAPLFRALAILLMLLYLSQPIFGKVGIIGAWETGTYHVKESGANRALIFIAHGEMAGIMNLAAVTYGGRPMTKIVERNYTATIEAYAAAYILDEAGIAAAANGTFVPTWVKNPAEIKSLS